MKNLGNPHGCWISVALVLAGCGSFTPPPPPELAALTPRKLTLGTVVEFFPAARHDPERDVWLQTVRVEAGLSKVVVHEAPLPRDAALGDRVQRLRSARKRGVDVLIVEDAENPAVEMALRGAHEEGVRVLIAGAVQQTRALSYATRVRFGDLEAPVHVLVRATRSQAKFLSLPDNGPVLIVSSPEAGPVSLALADEIERALKVEGARSVARLKLPENANDAEKIVKERLQVEPKITRVFAVDNRAFSPVQSAYHTIKTQGELVMAGALAVDTGTNQRDLRSRFAAIIDRRLAAYGRAVLETAVRLGRGESVASDVVVPLEVLESGTSAKATTK